MAGGAQTDASGRFSSVLLTTRVRVMAPGIGRHGRQLHDVPNSIHADECVHERARQARTGRSPAKKATTSPPSKSASPRPRRTPLSPYVRWAKSGSLAAAGQSPWSATSSVSRLTSTRRSSRRRVRGTRARIRCVNNSLPFSPRESSNSVGSGPPNATPPLAPGSDSGCERIESQQPAEPKPCNRVDFTP